jgi:hypothetical protein
MKTTLFYVLTLMSLICLGQFPTNGLVGEYSFTGGGLIDGANGANFTQNGSNLVTVNDRFSGVNNAIQLNEDYLTRPDIAISGTNTFAISYSFWIKTTTNNANLETIIDDSTRNTVSHFDSDDTGYYIYMQDGKINLTSRFYTRLMLGHPIQSQGYGHPSSKFIADDNWHHIVVEFRAYLSSGIQYVTSKIYVDAVAESNSVTLVPIIYSPNTTGNVTIANSRTNHLTAVNRYKDNIDDILIYNRILSQSEIDQISSINGYCVTPNSAIISSSTITNSTTDITISDSGTFDIAYHKANEPFASATILTGITSGNLTLTNLDEFTDYKVYIKKVCASNTTGWSLSHSFTTTRTIGKLYVNHIATGNNNGTSWTNAYTTLEDALANMVNDEEIWVAQGTYKPHASDRDLSFNITKSNVKLYGGFDGTESILDQRNPKTNVTILSGDLQDDDNSLIEFSNTTRNDNSYNIITVNANNSTIDGFTISDAHANGSSSSQQSGGAIFKSYVINNLNIYNCIIKNNIAIASAAGVYARYETTGSTKIHNNIFSNNLARWGTAIYSYTGNNFTANIEVVNSLFYNNEAKNNGSALGYAGSSGWFRASGSNSIMNCYLINNTYYNNIDTGTAANLNNYNRATVGMGYTYGTLNGEVANCIFWGNTTVGGTIAKSIAQIHTNLGQNIYVHNSIGEDGFSAIAAANLINTSNIDPLFTDPVNADFTLQTGSPAIDAGDGYKVPSGITTDLAGNPRFYNGTVDMGSYEQSCTSTCYTLTINITGNGHIENAGYIMNSQSLFEQNTVLSLEPITDTGYGFYEWSGDATGNTNPLTITIDSDKTINVTFIELPIYVDKDATGANDGSSWANAYTDLSNALNNVGTYKSIWIADGVYTPAAGNRTNTFNISTNDLKIYGGFNGTESTIYQRSSIANPTILSGDLNGDDTDVDYATSTRSENVYHVVTLSANGIALDGLTIQDGHANSTTNNELGRGSAIYKSFTANTLFLNNCIIKNNVGGKAGGAIFAQFDVSGTISINNTIFDNNLAVYGSGLYTYTNTNQTLDVTITNSLFSNNTSKNNGSFLSYTGSSAWIRAYGSGSAVTTNIVNSTFANNIDIGTQSGVHERGTLSLGRSSGTHNVTLSNIISYHNTGAGSGTTLAVSRGHVSAVNQILVYNSIAEDDFSNISAINLTNTSNSDPLFTDSANGDYTLQSGSPAIDAGDNSKIPVGVVTDLAGNTRIENTTVDMGCYERINLAITLSPKVFLQGAALNPNTGEESLMRDDLRIANYLPTTSPYADALTCNSSVFTTTGNDAIVDWVWVELRDKNDNTSVLHGQSALLQRDGDVVGLDGITTLSFDGSADDYYVAIKHRNHLGIMSASAIALSSSLTTLDFTDANNPITHGSNAQTTFGMTTGVVGMWSGNVGGDTSVKYQGSGNDTNTIKDNVLANTGNTTSSNLYSYSGYDMADINLDGTIKYQGSGNDSNSLKDVILSHPDNQSSPSNLFSILEQLPQ